MSNKKGPSETVLKLLGQGQFFFKVGHRSFFFCMSEKSLSAGTYMPNIKGLSEMVQKLWPMLFFSLK